VSRRQRLSNHEAFAVLLLAATSLFVISAMAVAWYIRRMRK